MNSDRKPTPTGTPQPADKAIAAASNRSTRTGVVGATLSGPPPALPALTGIRALGLGAVITYHMQVPLLTLLPAVKVAMPLIQFFFFGLDVFFVLSGFIISYNYAERLSTLPRGECCSFLMARVARIYPVFILTLVFTAILIGIFAINGGVFDPSIRHTALGFIGNVFMLQSLPGIIAWNTPSWSVSTEFAAYLVFPLAAGMLVRKRRRSAIISIGVILIVLIVFVRGLALFPEVPALLFYWGRLVCEFSIGCLLWVVWRNGSGPDRRWDMVAIAALCAAAVVVVAGGSSAKSWVAVGFLVVFVLATANTTGIVRAFLSSRPVEPIGRASYSIYLVHYPILYILYLLFPYQSLATAPFAVRLAVIAVYFAGPLLVGATLYRLFEEPARRWVRRRTARFGAPRHRDHALTDAPG